MTFENITVAGTHNAILGMRNPMMSHSKSDTVLANNPRVDGRDGEVIIGPNDNDLATRLIRAGSPHRKFLRQIFVAVDICKAPAYWMHEFATYKVGTTLDCSSTMHKIMSRPLDASDFEPSSTPVGVYLLGDVIEALNVQRENYLTSKARAEQAEKEGRDEVAVAARAAMECEFLDMKRMLPHSYLYERLTWTANYEVLVSIWKWRHNHRLPVWHTFCADFIEKLPHAEWILEAARR